MKFIEKISAFSRRSSGIFGRKETLKACIGPWGRLFFVFLFCLSASQTERLWAKEASDTAGFDIRLDVTSPLEQDPNSWLSREARAQKEHRTQVATSQGAVPSPQEKPAEALPAHPEIPAPLPVVVKDSVAKRGLVRLPLLPNPMITSFTGLPERQKKGGPKPAEQAAAPVVKKVDPEAVAAFTNYKKKQLEALESDRATLVALQAAIQELGLGKKLNFSNNALQGGAAPTNTAQAPKEK